MGKSSKPVIGYRHFMTLYMGECRTCDYLSAIEVGGEVAYEGEFAGSGEIVINKPMLFGGDKKEGGLDGTLAVRQGEADQMPYPLLQSLVPGPWPAARGVCTTVFDGLVGAMNPYLKLWKKRWGGFTAGWTTPVWEPSLCRIGRGKNPMHIIYQAFTDTMMGMGFSTSVIDEESFAACAQQLYDEEFGLCLPFRRAATVDDFIQIVCDHIAGQWAVDPRTGKITFQLFRGGYDPDTLPELNPSNILSIESFEQPLLSDSVNEVTVVGLDCVTNKDISATYQNLANVMAQGRVVNQKKQFPGLWNRELVQRVAERETAIASSLLARTRLTVSAELWGIKRGDVRVMTWPRRGWHRVPVLVLDVDEGTRTDSRIGLTLIQDVNGMPLSTYLEPVGTAWTPPDDTPKPLPAQHAYEASYRDLAASMRPADLALVGADSGYLVGLGAEPAGVAYGFDLHARVGTDAFEEVASSEFTPTGVLAAAIGPFDTSAVVQNGNGLSRVVVGSEWICGAEHGRVDAIDPETGALTIARGCVDTVPAAHAAGERIWFSDIAAGDPTEYLDGEEVEAKLLCRTRRGVYDVDLATTLTVTMAHRQVRPYPPGRVRVYGEALPSAVDGVFEVSWAHRDRTLQADTLVEHEAASIGPEEGTRYALRLLDAANALLIEKLDIDGNTATVSLAYTGQVTLELYALTDAGESWQRHVRTFSYTPPPGATEHVIDAATWTPTVIVIDGGEVTT